MNAGKEKDVRILLYLEEMDEFDCKIWFLVFFTRSSSPFLKEIKLKIAF